MSRRAFGTLRNLKRALAFGSASALFASSTVLTAQAVSPAEQAKYDMDPEFPGPYGYQWPKPRNYPRWPDIYEELDHKYATFFPRRIVCFIGPPAVGKDTQAVQLAERLEIPVITLKSLHTATELSDATAVDLILERIKNPDCCAGFVLTDFPTNRTQAALLERALAANGERVDTVFELKADKEALERRVKNKYVSPLDGKIYNLESAPPVRLSHDTEGNIIPGSIRGDKKREILIQLPEDSEENFKARYDAYFRETEPIIKLFRGKGIVKRLDANSTIEKVFDEVLESLTRNKNRSLPKPHEKPDHSHNSAPTNAWEATHGGHGHH